MKAEDFSHRLQSSERKGALLFVVLKRKWCVFKCLSFMQAFSPANLILHEC
jgi:hypothetical protein